MRLSEPIFCKLLRFKFFFIILFCSLSLFGQSPRFYIQTDRQNVEEGETLIFEIILENIDGKNMQMPDMKPFKVVQGPSTSTSVSIMNGKRTSTISYQYILLAPSTGKYKIPPSTVNVGNKSIQSNELSINVSPAGKNKDIQEVSSDEMTFVRLEVLDADVYIGQQMVLDYVLYTRQNVDGYHLLNELDLEGFFVQHISDIRNQAQKKVVNGNEYYVQVIKRDVLFPQKTGAYSIGPSNISLDIPVENGRSSFFFRETKKVNIKTNKIKVSVNNLPENAPISFSGGVGTFDMKATIKKNTVTTGEAIVVRMDISGDGDPKIVKAPIFEIPKNVEKYEPSLLKDETGNQREKIRFFKSYEYIFVPSKDTIFTIEPAFTYLSSESGNYETIKAGPFTIRVVKGNGAISSDEILTEKNNLSPISEDMRLYSKENAFFGSIYFIFSLIFVVFLAFLGMFFKKRKIAKKEEIEKQLYDIGNVAMQNLKQSKIFLDKNELSAFYEEISKATTGYILKKFNIQNIESDKDNVIEYLKKAKVADDLVNLYIDIQNKCELARFAGQFSDSKFVYNGAEELINGLEKEIKSM